MPNMEICGNPDIGVGFAQGLTELGQFVKCSTPPYTSPLPHTNHERNQNGNPTPSAQKKRWCAKVTFRAILIWMDLRMVEKHLLVLKILTWVLNPQKSAYILFDQN